jgi:hypothetical protein
LVFVKRVPFAGIAAAAMDAPSNSALTISAPKNTMQRMSGSSRWRMKSATQAYQIIPDVIFMRGWRSDDGFAFPASGRSSMPDKSN